MLSLDAIVVLTQTKRHTLKREAKKKWAKNMNERQREKGLTNTLDDDQLVIGGGASC